MYDIIEETDHRMNDMAEEKDLNTAEPARKRNLEDKFRDFLQFWPWAHKIFCKHEEILVYLVVGVLTTIVSWAAYGVCTLFMEVEGSEYAVNNAIANTISWIAGVCFAYPLNRSWVFRSTNPKILKEFLGFAASRLSTWFMDLAIMYVTVNIFGMDKWIAKIFISAVIVTIANYIFSKLLIFKKKK